MKHRAMHKKELAKILGVSIRTLRYWLNVTYFSELEQVGYIKTQKFLTPKQVSFLYDRLVITSDEP